MTIQESVVTAIFAEFSLRRVLWLFVVAAVLIAGAVGYERTSASVRLRRIERTADIADRLRQLDTARIGQDPALSKVQAKLKSDLLEVALSSEVGPDLQSFVPADAGVALRRFLSGATIWFLMCLGLIYSSEKLTRQQEAKAAGLGLRRGEKEVRGTVAGLSSSIRLAGILSLLLGVASVFLPLPDVWWVLIVVCPLTSLLVGMGLAAVFETILIGLAVKLDSTGS